MTYQIMLLLLMVHFFGDFIMQTHEMACNKSTSNAWLSVHVLTYSLCFIVFLDPFLFLYVFITHWVVDYNTSRMTAQRWKVKDYHNFFVVVGADQLIHYVTLIAYFQWIRRLIYV